MEHFSLYQLFVWYLQPLTYIFWFNLRQAAVLIRPSLVSEDLREGLADFFSTVLFTVLQFALTLLHIITSKRVDRKRLELRGRRC